MTGRIRAKVCGITRREDAVLAVDEGADAVGFILWEGSPRAVTARIAGEISRALPAFVTRVGVFVNAPPEVIEAAVREAALDAVQLHGDERPELYAGLGTHLVKAVALSDDAQVTMAAAMPAAVTLLVDAADRQRRGGTGRTADWTRAARLAAGRPVILAGGLTAGNVADAVRRVRPWAVDVSSGVEASVGRKSRERLRAFFDQLAAAAPEREGR